MFSNSDHEVTNLVQTNLTLSLLITTQTHADERNDEQQILSKDKIKYFIKNTSHLKICLFLSIFVAACVGPQSRHKGIVWCEGRTGEFLWSSWPLPHLARGDMHWRCTDALLSYCLSKLVVWKLRTFRMQPTRNNTRLQNPAGSVGGVLHGPLSRRVALGGNRCHYWHFQHYNYSSPFQQGKEVHKSSFSIIKILKSD